MNSISIWQLIIIALILGVPVVAGYRAHRAMREPRDDLARPLRYLTRHLVASLVALFLYAASGEAAETSPVGGVVLLASLLVMLVSMPTFWVALGVLARRLGRSAFLWIGLPLITSPIGPIVAYLWMRSLVKAAITTRTAEPASVVP